MEVENEVAKRMENGIGTEILRVFYKPFGGIIPISGESTRRGFKSHTTINLFAHFFFPQVLQLYLRSLRCVSEDRSLF